MDMDTGDPDFLADLHCVMLMTTDGVRPGDGERGVIRDYKATVGTDLNVDYAKYDFHSLQDVFRAFPGYFYMSGGLWFAKSLDEDTAAAVGMMKAKENKNKRKQGGGRGGALRGRGGYGSAFRAGRGRGGPVPQFGGNGQAARFGGSYGPAGGAGSDGFIREERFTPANTGFGQQEGGRGWNHQSYGGSAFHQSGGGGGGGNWNQNQQNQSNNFNSGNNWNQQNPGNQNFNQGNGWSQQQNQSNGFNQGWNQQQNQDNQSGNFNNQSGEVWNQPQENQQSGFRSSGFKSGFGGGQSNGFNSPNGTGGDSNGFNNDPNGWGQNNQQCNQQQSSGSWGAEEVVSPPPGLSRRGVFGGGGGVRSGSVFGGGGGGGAGVQPSPTAFSDAPPPGFVNTDLSELERRFGGASVSSKSSSQPPLSSPAANITPVSTHDAPSNESIFATGKPTAKSPLSLSTTISDTVSDEKAWDEMDAAMLAMVSERPCRRDLIEAKLGEWMCIKAAGTYQCRAEFDVAWRRMVNVRLGDNADKYAKKLLRQFADQMHVIDFPQGSNVYYLCTSLEMMADKEEMGKLAKEDEVMESYADVKKLYEDLLSRGEKSISPKEFMAEGARLHLVIPNNAPFKFKSMFSFKGAVVVMHPRPVLVKPAAQTACVSAALSPPVAHSSPLRPSSVSAFAAPPQPCQLCSSRKAIPFQQTHGFLELPIEEVMDMGEQEVTITSGSPDAFHVRFNADKEMFSEIRTRIASAYAGRRWRWLEWTVGDAAAMRSDEGHWLRVRVEQIEHSNDEQCVVRDLDTGEVWEGDRRELFALDAEFQVSALAMPVRLREMKVVDRERLATQWNQLLLSQNNKGILLMRPVRYLDNDLVVTLSFLGDVCRVEVPDFFLQNRLVEY